MAYVAAIHRWFEDWDFLLTPAVSVAAFPAEKLMPDHWPQHDWDWVSLGRVLLSVQHVLEPGRQRAVRLHAGRAAGRPADRRPALRRSRRAAGLGRVRGRCSPGRTSDRSSADRGVHEQAVNAFLLGFPALFSIVNPISGAFIFRGVTAGLAAPEREPRWPGWSRSTRWS